MCSSLLHLKFSEYFHCICLCLIFLTNCLFTVFFFAAFEIIIIIYYTFFYVALKWFLFSALSHILYIYLHTIWMAFHTNMNARTLLTFYSLIRITVQILNFLFLHNIESMVRYPLKRSILNSQINRHLLCWHFWVAAILHFCLNKFMCFFFRNRPQNIYAFSMR